VALAPAAARAFDLEAALVTPGENDRGTVVSIWELTTGKKRCQAPRGRCEATALTFSSDGLALAAGYADTTVLLWDITGRLLARPGAGPGLSIEAREQLWRDLASPDAERAYQAMRALAAAPGTAWHCCASACGRWSAGPCPRPRSPGGSSNWTPRTSSPASERPPSSKGRGGRLTSKPPLERRRRIERLLERLHPWAVSPEQLRALRALEVLEWSATREARQVLAALAGERSRPGSPARRRRRCTGWRAAPPHRDKVDQSRPYLPSAGSAIGSLVALPQFAQGAADDSEGRIKGKPEENADLPVGLLIGEAQGQRFALDGRQLG
jgi:hypothetical protein